MKKNRIYPETSISFASFCSPSSVTLPTTSTSPSPTPPVGFIGNPPSSFQNATFSGFIQPYTEEKPKKTEEECGITKVSEVDLEKEVGFVDPSKDPLFMERFRLENFHEAKMFEQKNRLMKKFNGILNEQHKVYEKKLLEELNKYKGVQKKYNEVFETREGRLKKRVKEIFEEMNAKEEVIKAYKEKIVEMKKKYHEAMQRLRKEQMQSKEITLDMNKGGDLLDDDVGNLIFGAEWFEETDNYDITELKEIKQNVRRRNVISRANRYFRNFYHTKFGRFCAVISLKRQIDHVENKFGSLIGTYFRLFSIQVLINMLVGVIVLVVYVPHIIFRFLDSDNPVTATYKNWFPNIPHDFLPPFLTFDSFRKTTNFKTSNKIVYALMVFPGFLIFFLNLFFQIVIENKRKTEHEVKSKDLEKKRFLFLSLNIWDHRATEQQDATFQFFEVVAELKLLLHQKHIEEKSKKRPKWKKIYRLCKKILGWTLIFATVFLSYALLMFFQFGEEMIADNISEWFWGFNVGSFLIPVAVTIVNSLGPKIACLITDFENYDREGTKVKILIVRLYLLKIFTILLLCVQYGMELYPSSSLNYSSDCKLKDVGDQIFLLITMSFLEEIFFSWISPVVYKIYKDLLRYYNTKRARTKLEKEQKKELESDEKKKKEEETEEVVKEEEVVEEEEGEEEEEEEENLVVEEDEEENEDAEPKKEDCGEESGKDNTKNKESKTKKKVPTPTRKKSKKKKGNKEAAYVEAAKKEAKKGGNKKVFETYKSLISLLYFQALIWISLPFVPISIPISAFYSFIMFQFQYFLLKYFMKKEKSPIGASDLGFYFMIFYIVTFVCPLVMYYVCLSVYSMNTYCGFGLHSTATANTTIINSVKDMGSSYLSVFFTYPYEHGLVNPLVLYVLVGGVVILWVGRNDKIKSLVSYANLISQRMKREVKMYENKIMQTNTEVDNLKRKVDKQFEHIKELKYNLRVERGKKIK